MQSLIRSNISHHKITKNFKRIEIRRNRIVTFDWKMDIVPIFIDWTRDFNYSETLKFNVMLCARYTIPSRLKVLRLMKNVS